MNKQLHFFSVLSLSLSSLLLSSHAAAVGSGNNFTIDESHVPGAFVNSFTADSFDLTYQACVRHDKTRTKFFDSGFFWISSYQTVSGPNQSQLNYYLGNGYRVYGIYNYELKIVGPTQATATGKRLNYILNSRYASISLYLDMSSDTEMKMTSSCKISSRGRADDLLLGRSKSAVLGEKSETTGLANGDFEVVFRDWRFNNIRENPFVPFTSLKYSILRFNGNVTRLRTSIGTHHYPEGSGNIFWQDRFSTGPGLF